MEVATYLYPNPQSQFEGATLTDIWGNAYPMRNEPFLELLLCGLAPGNYTVELLSPVRLRQAFKAESSHKTLFFSHPAFTDPTLAEVTVRISQGLKVEEFSLPLSIHKLTGRVRDFQGRPFPSYVWAVGPSSPGGLPETIVKTDSEGRFTLWYPEGKPLRVFVDDESYSRTTYECWIISEEGLKRDVQINPRVGDFELWGLHAWRTQLNWQVYFWPCSLPMDLWAKRLGRKFSIPRLRKEEITVRINGEKVPIKGLHRMRVWAGKEKGYLAHLLELPPKKKHAPL